MVGFVLSLYFSTAYFSTASTEYCRRMQRSMAVVWDVTCFKPGTTSGTPRPW
jgi:hypothetical protein